MKASLVLVFPLTAALAGVCRGAHSDVTVTVSALNYETTPKADWYAAANRKGNTAAGAAEPPAAPPGKPIFYAPVVGQIFPSKVPFDTLFKELAIALAHRGYFDVVAQVKAGRTPTHVDYFIRIDGGQRYWTHPVVRTDQITWGDAAMVSSRPDSRRLNHGLLVDTWDEDNRSGQDPKERAAADYYLRTGPLSYQGKLLSSGGYLDTPGWSPETRDYALILIQAFHYDDVRDHGRNARCAWGTFVTVPLEAKQDFSSVLKVMIATATPYLGESTQGVKVFQQAQAHVLVGTPEEVKVPVH